MNVINLNLEVIHYIEPNGEIIVEVYAPGTTEPILSTSMPVFGLVRELVEIMAEGKDAIEAGTEEAEGAYELVDELQDCIDYINDHVKDTE